MKNGDLVRYRIVGNSQHQYTPGIFIGMLGKFYIVYINSVLDTETFEDYLLTAADLCERWIPKNGETVYGINDSDEPTTYNPGVFVGMDGDKYVLKTIYVGYKSFDSFKYVNEL